MDCIFKVDDPPPESDSVSFTINETPFSVNCSGQVTPDTRLVDFIRNDAGLKGTKWTCREGGCGACVCTVWTKDKITGEKIARAVNTCLAPVLSCDGWDIYTVEGIGNKKIGYHPLQTSLVEFGGTQCGFCSPGMVMSMYALTNSKRGLLTTQDVEDNFDGNICRCTGYRPILDAFKSFAEDSEPRLRALKNCRDIEDLCIKCPSKMGIKVNPISGFGKTIEWCKSNGWCYNGRPDNLSLSFPSGVKWIQATDLQTLFDAIKQFIKTNVKYRIVAGNTGTGVFKNEGPYFGFIDVNNVPQIHIQTQRVSFQTKTKWRKTKNKVGETEAVLGGGTTLSQSIEFLQKLGQQPGFEYAEGMSKHIKRVANTAVRNFGTIAGNLMMKHAHNDFASDIFLLMESVGAKIYVASSPTDSKGYTPVEFLNVDMKGKVILHLTLPARVGGYIFRSFKIAKRYQNSHAYVNGGFLFKVEAAQNFRISEKPTICFGGINKNFVHASRTEEVLTGAELGDVTVLKNALSVLAQELNPDYVLPNATPQYRRSLALALFYKTVLGIVQEKVDKRLESGAEDLPRKQNSGTQIFDRDEEFKDSPLYKPVHKIEGLVQCSGEAEYVNDIPKQEGELFGVFVYVTRAPATLKSVDASEAMKMPGVVKFLTAKDIPGRNCFNERMNRFNKLATEEMFVEKEIKGSGQAVGLIVAESQEIAQAAASKVKIEYENCRKPIVTLKAGIDKAKREGNYEKLLLPKIWEVKSPDEPNPDSKHVIKGTFEVGSQFHFHMETQVTLTVPKEDGLTVYSATQSIDLAHTWITAVLNVPSNAINIEVRRLGGAFGAKTDRANLISCASALAAYITRRPVRISLSLESNFEMCGKRLPYHVDYQVGFDDSGKIDALNADVICDVGWLGLEISSRFSCTIVQSCYEARGWLLRPGACTTDTHTNTYCRSPGSTQAIAIVENIMEHIAHVLGKDSIDVRQVNYFKPGAARISIPGQKLEDNLAVQLVEQMKSQANYEARKKAVEEFNEANRWTKKGLAMVPMRYYQEYYRSGFAAFVAIHHQDGTVSVSHGGIEMGQGMNTKVAQTVAHVLGVPMSKIAVKPTNNLVSANSYPTEASQTSELVCYAVIQACGILKERMAPIQIQAANQDSNLTWEELVVECFNRGIDLRATYQYSSKIDPPKPYDVYGVTLVEVQIDVLTGEFKVARLDLIEDAGKSLSPEVDIGQIEGSVSMALGLWTEEKVVFDPDTGRILTRNSWEYKVPLPKSMPEEMNITIMKNGTNPYGVLRSKTASEPPMCLGVGILFAIKNAIKAARRDAGNTEWFQLNGPVTPEDVVALCLSNPQENFVY